VHTGHQQIIQLMKEEASRINGETVIITFHPHPRQVIAARQSEVFLLNTIQEKIILLEKYGIQHLVVTPFTEEFSLQTAEEYIENFLVKTFHPHTIIIGHDHRFGKSRSGDFNLLQEKATQCNYVVKEIPGFMLQNNTISSTRIREALLKGNIEIANEYLGSPYFFNGMVVEGNKLGRTIGYPTANLFIEEDKKLIPGNGVYAVQVQLRMIEVNIFDFDKEIYGDTLTVTILKRLRNEQKFSGLDELKGQLAKDKKQAVEFLGGD